MDASASALSVASAVEVPETEPVGGALTHTKHPRLDARAHVRYSQDMRSTGIRHSLRAMGAMTAIIVAACQPPSPVDWRDVQTITGIDDSLLPVREGGPESALDAGRVDTHGAACEGSVRVTHDQRGGLFAAWWAPRADSNATLLVARRVKADSGTWGAPVIADARDRSAVGCRRPAPAIAADIARGYVHLAYYLDAPTGAGVYGGHSMESGTYFHDPVAIVYGERPVATAIATSGDLIAVAYEDPNSERSRIALAISLTAGHIYEHRMDVSPASMRATNPHVTLEGRNVSVSWLAGELEQGAQGTRTMMRSGTISDDIKPASGGENE